MLSLFPRYVDSCCRFYSRRPAGLAIPHENKCESAISEENRDFLCSKISNDYIPHMLNLFAFNAHTIRQICEKKSFANISK